MYTAYNIMSEENLVKHSFALPKTVRLASREEFRYQPTYAIVS